MKDGFITVACGTPPLRLADCDYNAEQTFTLMRTAEKAGVKCQTKTKIAGGNDAGVIHTSRGGVRCAAVSIPSRYIHSASDAACKADIEAVYAVVKGYADTAGNL